jgi:hypothetical protein
MYYVENITSTSFILGTNRKCMNLRIHELAILSKPRKLMPTKKSTFTVSAGLSVFLSVPLLHYLQAILFRKILTNFTNIFYNTL